MKNRFALTPRRRRHPELFRLMRQHPFPAGLDDCVAAYHEIITEVQPDKLGMTGVSAGGTLIVATVLKAREEGLRMPAAMAIITPATDLTGAGDSRATEEGLEPVLSNANTSLSTQAYDRLVASLVMRLNTQV